MTFDFSELSKISSLLQVQDAGDGLRRVRVEAIRPDPNQPRKTFDAESIIELAQSIQSIGIIQPPVVRSHDDGYLLISGERRWRAARQLGWEKIDVIVRDDLNSRAQLVENIQREALSPWEIYRFISAELAAGTTQVELARALGKSGGWIGAYAAVVKMPPTFVTMLREERVADITALGNLHRLHMDMPDVAKQLFDSSELVTRPMIAAAIKAATARFPAAELNPARSEAPAQSAETLAEMTRGIAPEAFAGNAARENASTGSRDKPTPLSTAKSVKPLPIRIRAYFENAIWTVDYTRQRQDANRAVSVTLEGEDGSISYAPLTSLTIESIECL